MFSKVKKILNWEIFLFILVNFAILMNIFVLLDLIAAGFIVSILLMFPEGNIDSPWAGAGVILIGAFLVPIFIIIKYLLIPATFWIIQKYSKTEEIKNLFQVIAQNYKFQVMIVLIAIIVDSVAIFINYKYPDLYFNTYNFWYFIFGGLTGSYLVIFLFLFIRKKFKGFKWYSTKVFLKNIEDKLKKTSLFDLSK